MVAFFQDAVNAELVRYLVREQPGALGDRPGNVGRHPVHRVIVGVEYVLAAQHRPGAAGHVEPVDHVLWRLDALRCPAYATGSVISLPYSAIDLRAVTAASISTEQAFC